MSSQMNSSSLREQLWIAHGVLGTLSWGLVFPLGAILIRLIPSRRAWIVHSLIMLLGLMMFTVNVGIGLKQSSTISGVHKVTGVVIFALAWTQPISGFLHHYILKKHDIKTISSTMHVFLGRLLILSGIVEGGLGLLLSRDSTRGQNIVYGTLAGVIYVVYLVASLWFEARRENAARKGFEYQQKIVPYQEDLNKEKHSVSSL